MDSVRWILSPVRLPIPPPSQKYYKLKIQSVFVNFNFVDFTKVRVGSFGFYR